MPIGLWITAKTAGAGIAMMQLVAMRLRKVPPPLIVNSRINALKAGLNVTTNQLEAHYLARGHVDLVVNALISAAKAGIALDFDRAAAIDLAGRHVLEAVQMSVNPRVITTPKIPGVAKDGIQLLAVARITVRTNLDRIVGGAGEETILARVGEGVVVDDRRGARLQARAREPRLDLEDGAQQGARRRHRLRDPLDRHRRRRGRRERRRQAAGRAGRGVEAGRRRRRPRAAAPAPSRSSRR